MGFRYGHSLVVFDHWKRVQRLQYLEETFIGLSGATGAREPFALWGRERVAFFVLCQDADRAGLERAGREIARRWGPMLICTSASDLDQASS